MNPHQFSLLMVKIMIKLWKVRINPTQVLGSKYQSLTPVP